MENIDDAWDLSSRWFMYDVKYNDILKLVDPFGRFLSLNLNKNSPKSKAEDEKILNNLSYICDERIPIIYDNLNTMNRVKILAKASGYFLFEYALLLFLDTYYEEIPALTALKEKNKLLKFGDEMFHLIVNYNILMTYNKLAQHPPILCEGLLKKYAEPYKESKLPWAISYAKIVNNMKSDIVENMNYTCDILYKTAYVNDTNILINEFVRIMPKIYQNIYSSSRDIVNKYQSLSDYSVINLATDNHECSIYPLINEPRSENLNASLAATIAAYDDKDVSDIIGSLTALKCYLVNRDPYDILFANHTLDFYLEDLFNRREIGENNFIDSRSVICGLYDENERENNINCITSYSIKNVPYFGKNLEMTEIYKCPEKGLDGFIKWYLTNLFSPYRENPPREITLTQEGVRNIYEQFHMYIVTAYYQWQRNISVESPKLCKLISTMFNHDPSEYDKFMRIIEKIEIIKDRYKTIITNENKYFIHVALFIITFMGIGVETIDKISIKQIINYFRETGQETAIWNEEDYEQIYEICEKLLFLDENSSELSRNQSIFRDIQPFLSIENIPQILANNSTGFIKLPMIMEKYSLFESNMRYLKANILLDYLIFAVSSGAFIWIKYSLSGPHLKLHPEKFDKFISMSYCPTSFSYISAHTQFELPNGDLFTVLGEEHGSPFLMGDRRCGFNLTNYIMKLVANGMISLVYEYAGSESLLSDYLNMGDEVFKSLKTMCSSYPLGQFAEVAKHFGCGDSYSCEFYDEDIIFHHKEEGKEEEIPNRKDKNGEKLNLVDINGGCNVFGVDVRHYVIRMGDFDSLKECSEIFYVILTKLKNRISTTLKPQHSAVLTRMIDECIELLKNKKYDMIVEGVESDIFVRLCDLVITSMLFDTQLKIPGPRIVFYGGSAHVKDFEYILGELGVKPRIKGSYVDIKDNPSITYCNYVEDGLIL